MCNAQRGVLNSVRQNQRVCVTRRQPCTSSPSPASSLIALSSLLLSSNRKQRKTCSFRSHLPWPPDLSVFYRYWLAFKEKATSTQFDGVLLAAALDMPDACCMGQGTELPQHSTSGYQQGWKGSLGAIQQQADAHQRFWGIIHFANK